jgi:hypothetical protein
LSLQRKKEEDQEKTNNKNKIYKMSKYNLIDLFEEMSTTEKERFDRLSKDDQEKLEKVMAMVAKEKSMKEDKYDDIVDADDDIPADKKKEAAAAYRKVDKGASYEKATSHIKNESEEAVDLAIETSQKEAGIEENHQSLDREVADRIEGMLNIPLKKKFLDAGMDLIQDVLEEDPFYIDDIVSHLANELNAYYDSFGRRGDQLAGLGEAESFFKDDPVKIKVEKAVDNADRALKSVNSMKQVAVYMDSLRNDLRLNPNGAEDYLEYGKEDWIEDFENYIGDKALQEHFKRFI